MTGRRGVAARRMTPSQKVCDGAGGTEDLDVTVTRRDLHGNEWEIAILARQNRSMAEVIAAERDSANTKRCTNKGTATCTANVTATSVREGGNIYTFGAKFSP